MVKKIILLFFIALLNLIPLKQANSWGFFAHKQINRLAIFTLHPEIIGFFKKHIEYLTEHAVDPDKHRYAVVGEAPRHYIDIDHYAKNGTDPFMVVPEKWDSAVIKFSEDTLLAYGIVPWHIEVMVKKLTWAFRENNSQLILKYAADLGHYIGDAHVPLHTTENYNGQLTGQKGIHGFWESRLPELFFTDYSFWTGRAVYIENPLSAAWQAVRESFTAKDSVLLMEAELNKAFPEGRKYSFEQRGQSLMKVYSKSYSEMYHNLMDGMVERRMKRAILLTGSLWYTAWVNAGQPDLDNLEAATSLQMDTISPLPSEVLNKLKIAGHEDE